MFIAYPRSCMNQIQGEGGKNSLIHPCGVMSSALDMQFRTIRGQTCILVELYIQQGRGSLHVCKMHGWNEIQLPADYQIGTELKHGR